MAKASPTTSDPPAPPVSPAPYTLLAPGPHEQATRVLTGPSPSAWRGALLIVGGLSSVVLIALLDYATGPYISFGIFYLLPVAACAWWGGFPHGILLAVAGSVAGHMIDHIENASIPPAAGVWNGIVRFCTLTLVASLVSRLHAGVFRERLLARTDSLTGAANARTFYEAAAAEAEWARRVAAPLTLAYLDVDDFKRLNDRLGHSAGDEALRHIVQTIHLHLGGQGLLARLGGDEFALLLPGQAGEGVVALLTRLQEQLAHEMVAKGWPVSVSIGAITFLRPAQDVDVMIRRVDALMYGAKKKGKGRIEYVVMRDEPPALTEERRRNQRRATVRVRSGCPALVQEEGQTQARAAAALVYDISADGVGISLEKQYPLDQVLMVESLLPGPPTLAARVVRVTQKGGRWLHGCLLSTRLNAQDLGSWLGTGYGAPDAPSQKLASGQGSECGSGS